MKYYGVAVGKSTGVFTDWSEVEPLVRGFKGAKYKSFPSKDMAEAYVKSGGSDGEKVVESKGQSFIKNTGETCRVFMDIRDMSEEGKFRVSCVIAGFKETLEVNAWSWLEDYPALSELDMQCFAYVHALKKAYYRGYRELVIVYKNDCFKGWGTDWKPKSEIAKFYKSCLGILRSRSGVSIHFEKYDKGSHYHLEYLAKKNSSLENKSEEFEMFGFSGNL